VCVPATGSGGRDIAAQASADPHARHGALTAARFPASFLAIAARHILTTAHFASCSDLHTSAAVWQLKLLPRQHLTQGDDPEALTSSGKDDV
jgi:hypothetical protein